jgi:predicted HTH transcriptional regulator
VKIWKYQNNKQNIKITFNEAEMFLLKYLNENKKITVRDFVQKAKINKKEAERILVNFALTNVVKYEITEKVIFFTLFEE